MRFKSLLYCLVHHKSDHISPLLKTSQRLPITYGIQSFKAHHELALPPLWPAHPVSPPCHSGLLTTIYLRAVPGHAKGTPISNIWTFSSLCQELSSLTYWFIPSLHTNHYSNAIPSKQPLLIIFSQIFPHSLSITPCNCTLIYFLHSPYNYLIIYTHWSFM